MNETSVEMPKYQCHKQVWALKIGKLEKKPGEGAIMTLLDKRYAEFSLSEEFVTKHKPEVGGYYVVYDDGYKSFSPAKAFEEGYTLIS